MSISRSLWQTNHSLARSCLQHAFVQGLRSGSLPRERFAYYVGQDAFFLKAFARAYCIAAAKAPDQEGFRAFYSLAGGALDELLLHEGFAAEWGVDLRDVEPATATRAYTDFLLATAWSQDVGLTAAALAPCMRLYAFLGQELAQEGIPEHDYSRWIRTYSDPSFEELARRLESLVDRYAEPTAAHSTYSYAMRCELVFFDAAYSEQEHA